MIVGQALLIALVLDALHNGIFCMHNSLDEKLMSDSRFTIVNGIL